MARVIDIVWVVLDPAGDPKDVMFEEEPAEEAAYYLNDMTTDRGYHVKEAQLIWNE